MERVLKSWSGLASHFIGECFDLAKPFIDKDYTGIDPIVRFVAAQLFIDCHLSSESILILIREQREWDADLITRAVMEGSLKLTYMLLGSGEEIGRKVNEYWNLLPKFSMVKHSERAKNCLNDLTDPDGPEGKPFRDLLIDDAEISQIRGMCSRQERQAMEERWSFSGICRAFAKSENPGLRQFAHLAHGYGMSSHLLHKDGDGVGMVWERYGRDPERQSAVKLGHSARIVSDVCAFAQLRLFSLFQACQQPTLVVREIEERYGASLFDELTKAIKQFTQVEYGGRQG
jgi:hypothetical protein